MRKSASWMSIWDDRILEIGKEEGGVSVGMLNGHENIHITKSSISKRCQKLADKGLLKPIGTGSYILTDRGEGYLDGEYNVESEMWVSDGPANGEANGGSVQEPGH